MKHLVMDTADSWPTWAAFLGAAWGGLILVAAVTVRRIGRALAPTPSLDAEVEAAADRTPWPTPAAYLDPIDGLATSLSCTWCRPKPAGRCSCTGRCGHIRCTAPRSLFTAADQEILEGKRLP